MYCCSYMGLTINHYQNIYENSENLSKVTPVYIHIPRCFWSHDSFVNFWPISSEVTSLQIFELDPWVKLSWTNIYNDTWEGLRRRTRPDLLGASAESSGSGERFEERSRGRLPGAGPVVKSAASSDMMAATASLQTTNESEGGKRLIYM